MGEPQKGNIGPHLQEHTLYYGIMMFILIVGLIILKALHVCLNRP